MYVGNEVSAACGIGTVLYILYGIISGGDLNAEVRCDMGSDRLAARFNLPLRTCGAPYVLALAVKTSMVVAGCMLSFCANNDLALCTAGRVPGDRTWISGRGTPSRSDHVLAGSLAPLLVSCTALFHVAHPWKDPTAGSTLEGRDVAGTCRRQTDSVVIISNPALLPCSEKPLTG